MCIYIYIDLSVEADPLPATVSHFLSVEPRDGDLFRVLLESLHRFLDHSSLAHCGRACDDKHARGCVVSWRRHGGGAAWDCAAQQAESDSSGRPAARAACARARGRPAGPPRIATFLSGGEFKTPALAYRSM